jgi:ribosome-binding protein aMBF1 (putative translation factor)
MSRREAASYRHVSVTPAQYWIDRYRAARQHRPSTPSRQPLRVSEDVHDRVCAVRSRPGWGPRSIAAELGMAHATVSRCLARRGLPA